VVAALTDGTIDAIASDHQPRDADDKRLPFAQAEAGGAGLATLLWGPVGIAYLLELIDVTEQFDAFIPTATLIGLWVGWRRGLIFGRAPKTQAGEIR
jgi:hypothetical protein